jgi:imidazolonepropionase-like amidohydrolase
MSAFIFTGGRFFDPRRDELTEGVEVLVENGTVKEVADRTMRSGSAMRVAIANRTLMPGLIDAHIHVVLTEVNLRLLDDVPLTLLAAKGSVAMRAMLLRGFTTLRDAGGADLGAQSCG